MTQHVSKAPLPVGWLTLFFSVIYPFCVICIEFFTSMCAESFFNPMPTIYHALLLLCVPATNLALWLKLRSLITVNDRYLLLCSAVAITVAAYYTLIFLPILPIAAIGIIFMGLGLLPFAPLVSFICGIKLYRKLKQEVAVGVKKPSYVWKGALITFCILIVLDLPSGATYYGVNLAVSDNATEHNRGIKLLRTLGDNNLLLRLSYDGNRRPTGVISFIVSIMDQRNHVSRLEARQIYYQVTGEPFNYRPPPYDGRSWSRLGAFRFDNDQGGSEIGGRVEGLEMISSRLDGSVSGDDNVAYMEWVMEFKNNSEFSQEARLDVALPPGGIVSRASLWIEGEEREAAFAGRAQVRQAYQRVVRTNRDPLLVTTTGTDRVMVQAFPIQPYSGEIKFKIGITVPMALNSLEEAVFVLPAIVDRNFSFAKAFKHALWFESAQPMQLNIPELDSKFIAPNVFRISGLVNDSGLSATRKLLKAIRDPNILKRIAAYREDKVIAQEIVNAKPDFTDVLVIVVDGSESVNHYREAIISSLEHIPDGKKVGLLIASENLGPLVIFDGSNNQKQLLIEQLREHTFVGGQDNTPALTAAISALEPYENGRLLWIHAPQPVLFDGSDVRLNQALDRLVRLPKISLYSLAAGPNKLLSIPYIEHNAHTIPNMGHVEHDVSDYLQSLYLHTSQYKVKRSLIDKPVTALNGSTHIARLWARDRVFELIQKNESNKAIALAADHQLVTPVSGAVVLESQQQYDDNQLNPVEKNTVPTIPEPRQWVLAFITFVFLLWFLRRNRFTLAK